MNDTITLLYRCPACDLEITIPRTPDKLNTKVLCSGMLHLNVTTGQFSKQGHDPTEMLVVGTVGGDE